MLLLAQVGDICSIDKGDWKECIVDQPARAPLQLALSVASEPLPTLPRMPSAWRMECSALEPFPATSACARQQDDAGFAGDPYSFCVNMCLSPLLCAARQHMWGVSPEGPYHQAKNGSPQDRVDHVRTHVLAAPRRAIHS